MNESNERAGDRLTGWVQIALVLGVLLAAIVLNRLLMSSADDSADRVSVNALAPVEVIQPEAVAEQIEIEATGVVRVRTRVSLTPEVSGRVIEVSPELAAGGRFDAGETLFVIDPTDAELAIARAEADLSSAESALALEQAEANIAAREWRLVNGDEPIPALVAREPQLAQAQAATESARSRLGDARVALERTAFSMPFAGRVIASEIELGQTVSPSMSYGSVYAVDAVEIVLSIAESDAARLDPLLGRAVRIEASGAGSGRPIEGRVTRVAAELDARTRLVDVIVQTEPVDMLLPGAFVQSSIQGDAIDRAFWLPVAALTRDDCLWTVDDGLLQSTCVEPLMRSSDRVLTRTFDFAEGVVITPPPDATAGLAVQAINADSIQTGSGGDAGDD